MNSRFSEDPSRSEILAALALSSSGEVGIFTGSLPALLGLLSLPTPKEPLVLASLSGIQKERDQAVKTLDKIRQLLEV